jgi:hypothetical protein
MKQTFLALLLWVTHCSTSLAQDCVYLVTPADTLLSVERDGGHFTALYVQGGKNYIATIDENGVLLNKFPYLKPRGRVCVQEPNNPSWFSVFDQDGKFLVRHFWPSQWPIVAGPNGGYWSAHATSDGGTIIGYQIDAQMQFLDSVYVGSPTSSNIIMRSADDGGFLVVPAGGASVNDPYSIYWVKPDKTVSSLKMKGRSNNFYCREIQDALGRNVFTHGSGSSGPYGSFNTLVDFLQLSGSKPAYLDKQEYWYGYAAFRAYNTKYSLGNSLIWVSSLTHKGLFLGAPVGSWGFSIEDSLNGQNSYFAKTLDTTLLQGVDYFTAFPMGQKSQNIAAFGLKNGQIWMYRDQCGANLPVVTVCAGNMLVYPDFEHGLKGWVSFADTSLQGNHTSRTQQGTLLHCGSNSLSQTKIATAGEVFQLLFLARKDGNKSAQITLSFLDAAGVVLFEQSEQLYQRFQMSTYSIRAAAPSGTSQVKVSIQNSSNTQCIEADDFCLRRL